MSVPNRKRMLMLTDGHADNASARIRALQYIPFLEAQGYLVSHFPRVPLRPSNSLHKYFIFPIRKRWYALKIVSAILLKRWDIVFIQRIFISKYLLKSLNNRSITVIYDFDDAIYINEKHPESKEKTANMIRYATKVIVSTNFLEPFCHQYGKQPALISSPVETERIKPLDKPENGILTIGWIGSPWTSGFLEQVERPLILLAQKHKFRFLTIGTRPEYKIAGIDHQAKPWVYEEENEVLGQMDIGIMPLPDTDYARMKGGYKLLQYFSAGIPCVASPVGINQTIVKPGYNGFLAATADEWYAALEQLISDPDLRGQLGSNGRKEALETYSREVCFKKLLGVINAD